MAKVVSIEKHRTMRLADAIEWTRRANLGRGFVVNAKEVNDPDMWRRAAVMAVSGCSQGEDEETHRARI